MLQYISMLCTHSALNLKIVMEKLNTKITIIEGLEKVRKSWNFIKILRELSDIVQTFFKGQSPKDYDIHVIVWCW